MSQKTQCHCRWNPGTLHQLGFLSCWEGQLPTRPCFLWSRSHWGTLLKFFWLFTCFGVNKMDGFKIWSFVARFFFSFGKSGQGWVGVGGYSRDSCMKLSALVHSPPLPPVACSLEHVHSCSELWREKERERKGEREKEILLQSVTYFAL